MSLQRNLKVGLKGWQEVPQCVGVVWPSGLEGRRVRWGRGVWQGMPAQGQGTKWMGVPTQSALETRTTNFVAKYPSRRKGMKKKQSCVYQRKCMREHNFVSARISPHRQNLFVQALAPKNWCG